MATTRWGRRFLETTRGRVLMLLRRSERTVGELAERLELTENAVRTHLAGLERDGLVQQQGVRRGIGKPAHVYAVTAEGDDLFPKAYADVLAEVLATVAEREGPGAEEALLREVGRRIVASRAAAVAGEPLESRVAVAADVLESLGALVEVKSTVEGMRIDASSCPLAAVVERCPECCMLAAALVAEVVAAPVVECCDRSGRPACAFDIHPKP